jgi:membrane protease subunit HflC
MSRKFVAIGIAIIAVGITLLSATFTVGEQQHAIVLQFGEPMRAHNQPGLHFKVPFVQDVVYVDDRVLDFDADLGEIPTADQKQVLVDAFARYRIEEPVQFVQRAGSVATFERQLSRILSGRVQAAISRVDLQTLLTAKRAEIMTAVTKDVREETKVFGVEILDVRLKRIDLPRQNSEAVIQRMETQRRQEAVRIRAEGAKESQRIQAEADKRVRVIKAEAEKKGTILRGEGEAQATEIYNKAFAADRSFFEFWQCMQSVRDGLATNTRFVGTPSGELLFQLCQNPRRAPETAKN